MQASEFEYQRVLTEDGSPSVVLGSPTQAHECMHHRGGALSESLFIYHAALERSLELEGQPKVLSVGLGLGYNEAITVAALLARDIQASFEIVSFESDPIIRDNYVNWLRDETVEADAFWPPLFTDVLTHVSRHFGLSVSQLKSALYKAYTAGNFRLFGALEDNLPLDFKATCIYFDAFSKKATPDLWSEDFLIRFLNKISGPSCILATYAATGSLNRALRKCDFFLLRKPGFKGKRESTWAEKCEMTNT